MKHDPCVRCQDIAQAASVAQKLGWDGICILSNPRDFSRGVKLPDAGIDISVGIEFEVAKPSDVQRAIDSYRKKAEILAFRCADAEANRAVLEMPGADMLLGAWNGGINHVLANLAKENGIAVCFEFQPLMFSHGRQRTELFQRMLEAAKPLSKAHATIAIGSGAQMPMDLRDPGMLESFGRVLGFSSGAVSSSMSGARAKENKKRLSGKWIMPGVEIE